MKDHADETKRVCSDCVGESFLKAEIAKNGEDGVCSYCGEQGNTISVGEMAGRFELVLEINGRTLGLQGWAFLRLALPPLEPICTVHQKIARVN